MVRRCRKRDWQADVPLISSFGGFTQARKLIAELPPRVLPLFDIATFISHVDGKEIEVSVDTKTVKTRERRNLGHGICRLLQCFCGTYTIW